MKRAFAIAVGKPDECLELRSVPEPVAGEGDVVVEMEVCPIDPADLLLLSGRHLAKPILPAPLGIEGVGRVASIGERVEGFTVGQRVAVPFGGTWAERVAMRASDLLPLPSDVDPQQAAMLAVNPFTALGLLDGVPRGAWILQNAANSAVGRLVVRLAARRGVRTVNVVRRASLEDPLRRLGADAVVVDGANLSADVAAATGGAPIFRALDAVAGEAAGRLLTCIADGGTLFCYGLLSDDRVVLPASQLVFRDVTVRGFSRLRVLASMPVAKVTAMVEELTALLAAGDIATEIEATYPLERVREAVAHAAREERRGKILLTIRR